MTRATPLYFGDSLLSSPGCKDPSKSARLFGWLHEPSPEASLNTGIILCDSVGHSDTRYLHRKLAEQLATNGFATMRFDYYGTGNSSGNDDEPGLVASWIDSINAAVDTLMASHNLAKVCLVGFRLGGTLALAAAAKRTDHAVSDLILWAPLARGKVLCREIDMAQTVHYGKRRSEQAEPTLLSRHFFGFLPTANILNDLEKLDVTTLEKRPAERAWLVKRGEQPIDPSLIKRLEKLGVAITMDSVQTDPRVTLHPNLPFIDPFAEKVTEWIGNAGQSHSISTLQASAEDPSARTSVVKQALSSVSISDSVRETTFAFSTEPYLFGVLSEPASPQKKNNQAVMFLTSGASHHIGPGRLYVAAARDLAAMGHTAFRFDLSGIGDSASSGEGNEGLRLPKNAVAQVKLAMDALQRERGMESFALCGLCSGGRLAFAVAVEDDRVSDIQMINPPSLQMKKEAYDPFVQMRHVLGNARKWHRAFKGGMYSKLAKHEFKMLVKGGRAFLWGMMRRIKPLTAQKAGSSIAGDDGTRIAGNGTAMVGNATDAACQLRSELLRLSRRGVRPVFLYSGKDRGICYFNHFVKKTAEELDLPVFMYPEADHLFSEPHRALLLSIIARYLRHDPAVKSVQPARQPVQSASVRQGSGIHAALRDRAAAAVQASTGSRQGDRTLGMAKPG